MIRRLPASEPLQEGDPGVREAVLRECQRMAHVGSWEWDRILDQWSWSDELYRIFGHAPGEVPVDYGTFLQHVHPDDRAGFDAAVHRTAETSEPFACELRVRQKGGASRILVSRGWAEHPAHVVGVCLDATEQKSLNAARDAAESACRAKSDFLAAMSFELRNPLNAVIGFSELFETIPLASLSEQELRAFSGHIHEAGMHLLQLVNEILDVTKIEAGRLELTMQSFILEDAIQACVTALNPAIQHRNLAVAVPVGSRTVLQGDPVRFRQILDHLLSNACKFTPSGGRIKVEVEAANGEVRIAVEDTGIGVPREHLERIFEPFVQLGTAPASPVPGTGLGLTIARHLVEAHGGRLVVASEPGRGSRFTVIVPQHDAMEHERVRETTVPEPV